LLLKDLGKGEYGEKTASTILLVLLAIQFFASCSGNKPEATNSPEVTAAPKISAQPQTSLAPQTAPELDKTGESALEYIRNDYATEEFLAKYETYDKYVEPKEDEGPPVLVALSACVELRDFKFIELGYKQDGDAISFFENTVLYSCSKLMPEKPLVVAVSFPWIMPTRGISFIDESGTVRYFYLAMSGEDGSLLFVEF